MTLRTSVLPVAAVAVALLAAVAPSRAGAQQGASPPAAPPAPALDVPKGMTRYFVALLTKGERWTAEQTPEQMEVTRGHLAHTRRQIEAKAYVFAGPMLDGATSRTQGIIVLTAPSAAEARRIVSDDPAVRAGRFAVELHPAMLPSLAGVDVRY